MAILSIAIPSSARRLAPSAPHSAAHPPPSGLHAMMGSASALATPAVPSVPILHQMHEVSAALASLNTLEDLLTALRAK